LDVVAFRDLRITSTLFAQFEEGEKLEKEIKKNLAGLGYE
jgi:hypothetical protein